MSFIAKRLLLMLKFESMNQSTVALRSFLGNIIQPIRSQRRLVPPKPEVVRELGEVELPL